MKINKTKEEKLLELRFWFESNGKKYIYFRGNKVYIAILEAINRFDYKDFLPIDIIQDMSIHNPQVVEELRGKNFFERSVGSHLKQLTLRSILEIKGEKPSVRQKVFGINSDVMDEVKRYVGNFLKGGE